MNFMLNAVSVAYGGLEAIHEINLVVRPREIVTLVGNNGAGKSTLVKAISGLIPVLSGSISFEERADRRLDYSSADAVGDRARAGGASDIFRFHYRREFGAWWIFAQKSAQWHESTTGGYLAPFSYAS